MGQGTAAFANMRTRMQRLKDAKFFSGWVSTFDEQEARIRLTLFGECDPGDRFLVEVFGPETVAVFQGVVSMAFDNHVYLNVLGPVQYRRTTENARVCVTGMIGTVTSDDGEMEARISDISRGGVGMIVRKALPRKDSIHLKLLTPAGEVTCDGEVRYCRPDPSGNGTFRAGIRLGDMARLEKARWLSLFRNEAA